jgi:hypothetical protein
VSGYIVSYSTGRNRTSFPAAADSCFLNLLSQPNSEFLEAAQRMVAPTFVELRPDAILAGYAV